MSALHGDDPAAGAANAAGALAWVADEIRAALEGALASARGWAADPADSAQLRTAERQLHAAAGALHLLDLRGAALTAEAGESLLRQWVAAAPQQPAAALDTVQAAVGALLLYLDRLLAGRDESPLRLFPYYRDLLRQTGASRIHPADLLPADLSVATPPWPTATTVSPRRRRGTAVPPTSALCWAFCATPRTRPPATSCTGRSPESTRSPRGRGCARFGGRPPA
jgi:hypothetical protein